MHLSLTSKLRLVFILSFSHFCPFITPIPSCNCLALHSVSVFLFTLFVCPMNRAIAFAFNNHLCNLLFDSTQLASPLQIVCPVIVVTIVVLYCCCCCCCCESLGVVQAATAAATAAATGWNQSRKTKLETKSKLKQKQKPEAFVRKIQSLISVWPAN